MSSMPKVWWNWFAICVATGVEDSCACDVGPAGANNCASGQQLTICTCAQPGTHSNFVRAHCRRWSAAAAPSAVGTIKHAVYVWTAGQFEMRIHTSVCFASAVQYHRQHAAGEYSGAAANWFRHGGRHSRYIERFKIIMREAQRCLFNVTFTVPSLQRSVLSIRVNTSAPSVRACQETNREFRCAACHARPETSRLCDSSAPTERSLFGRSLLVWSRHEQNSAGAAPASRRCRS